MAAKKKVAGKVSAAKVAKKKDSAKDDESIEQSLWDTAIKLRGSVESSEYKHVVLSLIFLKFASDKFEARRKDTDALWTKKNIINYYGYKNHVSVDNENKLIRRYDVTTASVHDSQVFDGLLDPDNTNANVWADSVYRSAEQEVSLNKNGYRSQINTKGTRNKPLSKRAQQANYKRSKLRSRVEHVLGVLPKLLSGQPIIPDAEKIISNAT